MTHYSSKNNTSYWSQQKRKKDKKALKNDQHSDQSVEKNQWKYIFEKKIDDTEQQNAQNDDDLKIEKNTQIFTDLNAKI